MNAKVFVLKNDGKLGDEVTNDWKIENKGQTLTATPNDQRNTSLLVHLQTVVLSLH